MNTVFLQVEKIVWVPISAYQEALLALVGRGIEEGGLSGVSIHNSVMEMRNICNHPYLSKLHVKVKPLVGSKVIFFQSLLTLAFPFVGGLPWVAPRHTLKWPLSNCLKRRAQRIYFPSTTPQLPSACVASLQC